MTVCIKGDGVLGHGRRGVLGPLGVEGDITGDGSTEIKGGCIGQIQEPAAERPAVFGGILRLRGGFAALNGLGSGCGSVIVCVKGDRHDLFPLGDQGAVRIGDKVRRRANTHLRAVGVTQQPTVKDFSVCSGVADLLLAEGGSGKGAAAAAAGRFNASVHAVEIIVDRHIGFTIKRRKTDGKHKDRRLVIGKGREDLLRIITFGILQILSFQSDRSVVDRGFWRQRNAGTAGLVHLQLERGDTVALRRGDLQGYAVKRLQRQTAVCFDGKGLAPECQRKDLIAQQFLGVFLREPCGRAVRGEDVNLIKQSFVSGDRRGVVRPGCAPGQLEHQHQHTQKAQDGFSCFFHVVSPQFDNRVFFRASIETECSTPLSAFTILCFVSYVILSFLKFASDKNRKHPKKGRLRSI